VKQLNVKITRKSTTLPSELNFVLNIYPSISNCQSIVSPDTCSIMPSCIFCYRYNDVRLLSEVDDDEFNESDINSGNTSFLYDVALRRLDRHQRKLFPRILPDSGGQEQFDESKGQCKNGWLEKSCTSSYQYQVNGANLTVKTFQNISTSCLLFVIILFAVFVLL
jgi:hypothetical protein